MISLSRKDWKKLIGGLAAIGVLVVSSLSLTACGSYNDHRGKGDAPVLNRSGDDSPAFVTNQPDTFGNASAKCLYGFPGMAVIVSTKKIPVPFPYKGCDGKGHAPDAAVSKRYSVCDPASKATVPDTPGAGKSSTSRSTAATSPNILRRSRMARKGWLIPQISVSGRRW